MQIKAVDFQASLDDVLKQANGRSVKVAGGQRTADDRRAADV